MREVVPGVYEWSWFSDEKQLNFNGHLVIEGSDRVLIDPPPMIEADRADIERRGGVTAIVLTNRDHVRESAACQRSYGAPVWVPAADTAWIDVRFDRTYEDATRVPGGLVVIRVPDSKSPGESALWSAGKRALIVGDAVIGKPPGALGMLPDDKFADPAKARAGLRVLLDARYDYDAVLVGDGVSIPTGGHAVLERLATAGRGA
jgi:glyoxylase-like metal-dependent hydrolase (beta-lactamase superfamily II)